MRVKYSDKFSSKYAKQEVQLDVIDFLNEQFPFIDYSVNSAVVDNLNIKTVFNLQKFIINDLFTNMLPSTVYFYLSENQFQKIEKQIKLLKIDHDYFLGNREKLRCRHILLPIVRWVTCMFVKSNKISDNHIYFSSYSGPVKTQTCFFSLKNIDASLYFFLYKNNYYKSDIGYVLGKINVKSLDLLK